MWWTVIFYFTVVILVGFFASNFSSRGISEFFVGGRKINRFVVALSAVASGRSAWLFIGFTGTAYVMGVSAVWALVGYIVVEMLLFFFFAPRIRDFAEKRDVITLIDYYLERFGSGRLLRFLLAGVIVIFMVSYLSAQLVAGGKAVSATLGIGLDNAIFLTALVVVSYTVLGGFLAVSVTDSIQAIFMLLGVLTVVFLGCSKIGGLFLLKELLEALNPSLVDPLALSLGSFIGFLAIGLGSPGNPHIIVRYISIEDSKYFPIAAVVGTVWNVVVGWSALLVGLLARVLYPSKEVFLGADPEQAFLYMAKDLLPSPLYGLVLASVFAAIMSTADSQLLVASSTLIRDIYQKMLKPDEDSKRLVVLSRVSVVALTVVAVALSAVASNVVFTLVLYAWAGLGAAIGPTILLGVYWEKTNYYGVVAGIIVGTVTVIVWKTFNLPLYELIPGFIFSILATVVVTSLVKKS